MKRNPNMAKLRAGYLFPEINKHKRELLEREPDAKIISLGIGNTTEPLTPFITKALEAAAKGMGTPQIYSGYGDEQGFPELRSKIASVLYKNIISENEVFVSDGAKCDIGRLQILFGPDVKVAVQDPSYPVYVDGSVILGATGEYSEEMIHFKNMTYMDCRPENKFFPDLSIIQEVDVIYFCSPNNPTGAVATKEQLTQLVNFAKEKRAIIVFDAAYSEFIKDPDLPKSIYEIPGAKEVAIEVNSFSKPVGFTGVRLGWTIVPNELKYEDGSPVINDWNRITSTIFNGASNIVQYGGLAALDIEGIAEMKQGIKYYMENARIIKEALNELEVKTHGGENAPYIWAEFPGQSSWEVFAKILQRLHIVTTPGAGFGPAGEGFVRFSAFGHRKDILEAVQRLKDKALDL